MPNALESISDFNELQVALNTESIENSRTLTDAVIAGINGHIFSKTNSLLKWYLGNISAFENKSISFARLVAQLKNCIENRAKISGLPEVPAELITLAEDSNKIKLIKNFLNILSNSMHNAGIYTIEDEVNLETQVQNEVFVPFISTSSIICSQEIGAIDREAFISLWWNPILDSIKTAIKQKNAFQLPRVGEIESLEGAEHSIYTPPIVSPTTTVASTTVVTPAPSPDPAVLGWVQTNLITGSISADTYSIQFLAFYRSIHGAGASMPTSNMPRMYAEFGRFESQPGKGGATLKL